MSVIMVTPVGATAAKNWNTNGNTRKYANAMPE
jgi:hypothetical protein